MHRPLPFLGCALVIGLAGACGGGDAGDADSIAAADSAAMAAPVAPADTMAMPPAAGDTAGTLAADVDTVAAAAERGLTSLAPAVAIPIIQRIEDALDATNVEALDEMATDLESLREELDDDTIDGSEVGNILTRLGGKVTAYAPNAPEAVRAKLTTLGASLTRQGRALTAGR